MELSSPDSQLYANGIIEQKIVTGHLLDFGTLPPWCPAQLVSMIRKCCKATLADRFDNVSSLITKLNNIRPSLPDWRLEPAPVLYRDHARFRIVEAKGQYCIEKMVTGPWRKIHAVKPCTLKQAITAAESL